MTLDGSPFILLLGLAGAGAAAVLFSAITSAGRRSFRATAAAQGRHWLEGLGDQTQLEEIHERVVKGNKN